MAGEASVPAPDPQNPAAATPAADPPLEPVALAAASPPSESVTVSDSPGSPPAIGEAPPIDADLAAAGAALDQISIDELLKQASFEDPTALGGAGAAPDASELKLPNFQQ